MVIIQTHAHIAQSEADIFDDTVFTLPSNNVMETTCYFTCWEHFWIPICYNLPLRPLQRRTNPPTPPLCERADNSLFRQGAYPTVKQLVSRKACSPSC